jgi:hypothetical protein
MKARRPGRAKRPVVDVFGSDRDFPVLCVAELFEN